MRLALIGVGLIGGSFARAARAAGKIAHVVGFDTDLDAVRRAVKLGVIDEAASKASQAVAGANLVMIATPVGAIRQVLRDIAPHLHGAALVTDVGSTKVRVIEAAREELATAFPRFVPGHPIAGREQSGVDHADVALFRDKVFISTPVAHTNLNAVESVEALWRETGCRTERMTPEEHDGVFAAVSHLPHLLAFALVAHIATQPDSERRFALAGAGFRDFTRIAASDAEMWSDICVSNPSAIGNELRSYREQLEQLQRALDNGDRAALRRVFLQAATTRARRLTKR